MILEESRKRCYGIWKWKKSSLGTRRLDRPAWKQAGLQVTRPSDHMREGTPDTLLSGHFPHAAEWTSSRERFREELAHPVAWEMWRNQNSKLCGIPTCRRAAGERKQRLVRNNCSSCCSGVPGNSRQVAPTSCSQRQGLNAPDRALVGKRSPIGMIQAPRSSVYLQVYRIP